MLTAPVAAATTVYAAGGSERLTGLVALAVSLIGLVVAILLRCTRYIKPAVITALVALTLSWWFLLGVENVETVEAYTLPPALVTLGLGAWASRRRPELRSWLAYGPGLLGALLPSLVWSLPLDSSPLRRLLLGAAATVVVLFGARTRLRAPLAIGTVVLLVLAVHELILVGVRASYWIPLAIAGALLVAFGATYERRRRDLQRLAVIYENYR
ncbi:MAG: hypothetical protein H0T78_03885 [Longispora sp.]|nr:hypothetical protein [Longispora sp. (in: high G+C Gram-positive bacteria)]